MSLPPLGLNGGMPPPGAPPPGFPEVPGMPGNPVPAPMPLGAPDMGPLPMLEEQDEQPAARGDGLVPAEARALVDYTVHINKERRTLLGRHIAEEIRRYHESVENRRLNVQQWRWDYKMMPATARGRWKNSANLNSPFSHIYANSHATKLDSQLLNHDPPFTAVARKTSAVAAAPHAEEALAASLEESEWSRIVTRSNKELTITGNVLIRLTYEEEWRRLPDPKATVHPERFAAQTSAGIPADQAFAQSVDQDRKTGLPKVKLEFRDELLRAGPTYKVIPWENSVVIPAGVTSQDDARGIGERMRVTGAELKCGADCGKYLKDAVDELLESASAPLNQDDDERREVQGIEPELDTDPVDFAESALYKSWEVYELCWYGDYNDDGYEELCVVTLEPMTETILRFQYMPYEHGQPYYTMLGYLENEDDLFAMGVCELIAVLQAADKAIMNAILDYTDLLLNRSYMYDPTRHTPEKGERQLNRPLAVKDLGSTPQPPIQWEQIPTIPSDVFVVQEKLKTTGDLLTNVSNPALGRETEGEQTLGELQILTAASGQIFEGYAANVARQWCRLADQHRLLMAQFGDMDGGEVKYRKAADPGLTITGDDGQPIPAARMGGQVVPAETGYAFGSIPAEMLRADLDFIPSGLAQLGDWQSRLQQAMLVHNTIMQSPLVVGGVPVTNPDAILLTLDYLLQTARFPGRDKLIGLLKGQVEQQKQMQAIAMQAQMDAANQADAEEAAGAAPGAPPGEGGPAGEPGAPPNSPTGAGGTGGPPPAPDGGSPAAEPEAGGPPPEPFLPVGAP